MTPAPVAPDLLGAPVATWALVVSGLSFLAAVIALGWQVAKHFLDGGRVKVYLNTAILEPGYMLLTNRSGRFSLQSGHQAHSVTHGRALELAQLVVENPGRVPVTIYSPGLSIAGHGKKGHTITPRMFKTENSFGPDEAVDATVVRLEPYGRVTFLLDYWGVVSSLLEDSPKGWLALRGYVGVAGRTKRPQKSRRRFRWQIHRGTYTAIEGSPHFTPLSVMWRAMYVQLPERDDDEPHRHPEAGSPITRGMLYYLLERVMSDYESPPDREEFGRALDEVAKERGDRFPMLGSIVFEAYQALDRMEGHLTDWSEGLPGLNRKQATMQNKDGETDLPGTDEAEESHDRPHR